MKTHLHLVSRFVLGALASTIVMVAVGCSSGSEDNPITPEKMSELRKKENEARSSSSTPAAPTSGDRGPGAPGGSR